jgi:hypothetical protein
MAQRLSSHNLGHRWRGDWFMLTTDNKKVVTCPITDFQALDDTNQQYLAQVPVELRRKGAETWTQATFIFHVKVKDGKPKGDLVYAFAETKQGPLEVRLKPGDSIRPVYLSIAEDGDVTTWTAQQERAYIQVENPADFTMTWARVGAGRYEVGFEIVNLAGIENIELVPVRVE